MNAIDMLAVAASNDSDATEKESDGSPAQASDVMNIEIEIPKQGKDIGVHVGSLCI